MELCQKFGLVGKVKWYNEKPASVVENDRVKILWDFNIETDHVSQPRRPDIVVLSKTERKCHLNWYCCAWGQKDWVERTGNIDNYSELRREVKKIWNLSQIVVVPVVIGTQGVTSKRLKDWLKKLDVKSSIELLQKAALLGTAKIVRQVLETLGC